MRYVAGVGNADETGPWHPGREPLGQFRDIAFGPLVVGRSVFRAYIGAVRQAADE